MDRFDRMLVSVGPCVEPAPVPRAPLTTRSIGPERQPVITSTRGPRFVAHATCPWCGTPEVGVEYQGELRSGAKVHTLAAHTAGMRRTERGQPLCLGARMRMVLEGGTWKGAQKP